MNKILQFTRKNNNPDVVDRNKYVLDDLENARLENIQVTVDYATSEVVAMINRLGYNICDSYDIGLVHEAIKSMASRTCGIDHPLQSLADDTVVIVNDVGEKVHANGSIADTTIKTTE